MLKIAGLLMPALLVVLMGCSPAGDTAVAATEDKKESEEMKSEDKVFKTDEEWQKELTPEQYRVTRKAGTERAFTGETWDEKRAGTYLCVCCDQPLFDSETKFDSGTGWPSFYEPIDKKAVAEEEDNTLFSRRTEVLCSRCDAHLGHVFTDGPEPTGLRYCMNSAAMTFVPEEEGEKAEE